MFRLTEFAISPHYPPGWVQISCHFFGPSDLNWAQVCHFHRELVPPNPVVPRLLVGRIRAYSSKPLVGLGHPPQTSALGSCVSWPLTPA